MEMKTLHHLACSGGTVVSKCIQAMHNVIVISEVHPDAVRYKFNPFDPTQLLLGQTTLKQKKELRHRIFLNRIGECATLARLTENNIVLRDHTHTDYMATREVHAKSALLDVLQNQYTVKPILTVRNPIEAYISLLSHRWGRSLSSFNDYCIRYEVMLDHYRTKGALVLRYEDFCRSPDEFLQSVCAHWHLEYNANFRDVYSNIPMTGDSGRGRAMREIKELKPKPIPDIMEQEISKSDTYARIAADLNYSR